jgi:hypothetical protein
VDLARPVGLLETERQSFSARVGLSGRIALVVNIAPLGAHTFGFAHLRRTFGAQGSSSHSAVAR